MTASSFFGLLLLLLVPASEPAGPPTQRIHIRLSEWKVEMAPGSVPAGPVSFVVKNTGTIPHAFEVEGGGLEEETPLIQPGDSATLTLTLADGRYQVYCPVGDGSHKMLGMTADLRVGSGMSRGAAMGMDGDRHGGKGMDPTSLPHELELIGGGTVIQILPGPFPFADSARAVYRSWSDERDVLDAQARRGPYSDEVSRIEGSIRIDAWDRGASRDSVQGTARFVTSDGAEWKLDLDHVQTKDVPRHPRFGGVIFGLYYHGATGVHTPLVPTINSAAALWAVGRLTRNGAPITDQAQVHIMLLSRTRRPGDFALDCWDCSRNPVDELQLQVTPPKGAPDFPVPGGVLFVNWEGSRSGPVHTGSTY